jgi:threonine synthase
MRFTSTRGRSTGYTFEQALFSGYAPDGGMFMPERVPHLSRETLLSWRSLGYREVVLRVLELFIGDEIPSSDLSALLEQCWRVFAHEQIVHFARVGEFVVMELFHGPTLAFKDLAMQFVGHAIAYFLRRRSRRLSIVVGSFFSRSRSRSRSCSHQQALLATLVHLQSTLCAHARRSSCTCCFLKIESVECNNCR